MSINLQFKDLDTFEPIGGRQLDYAGAIKNLTSGAAVTLYHPKAGRIGFTSLAMPHLQILHMDWQTGAEQVILEGHEQLTRTIGISFQTGGYMHTQFKGISQPLQMKAGRNNLVYTPEPGDVHRFSTNNTVSALQLNLDVDYFKLSIGTEDAWAEHTLQKLEAGIPFSAVDDSAPTTSQMAQLVDSIVNCPVIGPMRNLMIQSRSLELLALQFEQFRGLGNQSEKFSPEDVEKLFTLKMYLDQHFLTEFSLTQLSRNFYINEFKLKKGFKELFGHTVFGYIRKLRMEHAQLLLKDTASTVEEVAFILGYENSNHFSTAFKNYFGNSPSLFRKKR
jgi:AraC family transcriptional regulator, transcriptional activator of the genes for pyochelin and ferripyochelin receptors